METSSNPGLVRRGVARWILLVCVALGLASLVMVLVRLPGGTPVSSDPGAPALPVWVTVGPSLVGALLVLAIPWRRTSQPAQPGRPSRLALTTGVLLLLAAAFPVLARVVPAGEMYVLTKFALFMVIPAVLVLLVRGAVRVQRVQAAWRWWAPALVVAVWTVLSQVAPWKPPYDPGSIDLETLVVAATATAVTAGIGEELFYRLWLQTRLEAIVGAWPGIAVTSILFGLMHLGSHGSGDLMLDTARVIVMQGSFGLFMGVLWWRYRNISANIVAHLIINGWGVAAYLLTSG